MDQCLITDAAWDPQDVSPVPAELCAKASGYCNEQLSFYLSITICRPQVCHHSSADGCGTFSCSPRIPLASVNLAVPPRGLLVAIWVKLFLRWLKKGIFGHSLWEEHEDKRGGRWRIRSAATATGSISCRAVWWDAPPSLWTCCGGCSCYAVWSAHGWRRRLVSVLKSEAHGKTWQGTDPSSASGFTTNPKLHWLSGV